MKKENCLQIIKNIEEKSKNNSNNWSWTKLTWNNQSDIQTVKELTKEEKEKNQCELELNKLLKLKDKIGELKLIWIYKFLIKEINEK